MPNDLKEMLIRKADLKDIEQILNLLSQVLEIHAKIRPDVFISSATKYTKEELVQKLNNKNEYIYVATINEYVVAYAFCEIKKPAFPHTMVDHKIMYVDDFCVDEKYRRQNIGKTLFEYIKKEALNLECYEITLSCWEGNDTAKKFYEELGLTTRYTSMEYILK